MTIISIKSLKKYLLSFESYFGRNTGISFIEKMKYSFFEKKNFFHNFDLF